MNRLVVEARETLEPVKLWDEGQPSHIISQDQFRTWERRNIGTRRTNVLTYRRTQYIFQELDYVFKETTVPTQIVLFPYSNSQNIIRVNLLGNHSTSYITTLLIIYSPFLYTQPINRTNRSISYKVPLYNYYHSYGREEQ